MRQAPRKHGLRGRARPAKSAASSPTLTIRINFAGGGFLGPGKAQLMGLIAQHGSIRSAGKEMGMSYRRAWLLADEINQIFGEAVIVKQMGGAGGGGAKLSALGEDILQRYRAIEAAAATANAQDLAALSKAAGSRTKLRSS